MCWARKGAQRKGKGQQKQMGSLGNDVYQELVQRPEMHIRDSPVIRGAAQFAVDHFDFDWNAPRSRRVWTSSQAQIRLHRRRWFTTGPAVAHDKKVFHVSVCACRKKST